MWKSAITVIDFLLLLINFVITKLVEKIFQVIFQFRVDDHNLTKILDTHMEEFVLYWIQYKNSLKYKVGCFWRFSYVYTIN